MANYKIQKIEHLAENTFLVRADRPSVPIKAGQCFNVGIPGDGVNREYSMYSGANDDYIEFLIRRVEGGCVSPRLEKLKPGDRLEIDGPYGEFCLKGPIDVHRHHLFLATGTGIAPFHSFFKTFPKLNFTILHGVRYPEETYHATDYPEGRYIPCITRNSRGRACSRLTDYLEGFSVSPDSAVYLCGNRNMIVDAFEMLRNKGISGDNLFTEVFF